MQKVVPNDAVLIPETAECMFKGVMFDVYQWQQKLYDGSETTFEMLRRPDTVSTIALVDNRILVIDDEQPGRPVIKKFPTGRVEPFDKGIVATAQREVKEETGYTFKNWKLLKVWQFHPKFEWFVHLLLAWDVESKQATKHDAGEIIKVSLLTFDEVSKLALNREGYLKDSIDIFESVSNLDELMAIPKFKGQVISSDREL
jgi:8-oxo-dGTP pyrophosphatase MutT (NUDIX family)